VAAGAAHPSRSILPSPGPDSLQLSCFTTAPARLACLLAVAVCTPLTGIELPSDFPVPREKWQPALHPMRRIVSSVLLSVILCGCAGAASSHLGLATQSQSSEVGGVPSTPASRGTAAPNIPVALPFRHPLPNMPPVIDNNIYAATGAGMLDSKIASDPAYLYVPDSTGTTTTVINQRTRHIVRIIKSGPLSEHVNPSYDLTTLYVDASEANNLVAINPQTAKVERRIAFPDRTTSTSHPTAPRQSSWSSSTTGSSSPTRIPFRAAGVCVRLGATDPTTQTSPVTAGSSS
jgi:hypothetical protein